MSLRETFLLNANTAMTVDIFSKHICEEVGYDLDESIALVNRYLDAIHKGLQAHCEISKIDFDAEGVPDFVKSYFEKSGKMANAEMEQDVEITVDTLKKALIASVTALCSLYGGKSKEKASSTIDKHLAPSSFSDKIKEIFSKIPNRKASEGQKAASKLIDYIENNMPEGVEKENARSRLKETIMWINEGLR